MKTFKIKIKEILENSVEIQAEDTSDAIQKVKELYQSAEIVLDYTDFVEVDFTVMEPIEA